MMSQKEKSLLTINEKKIDYIYIFIYYNIFPLLFLQFLNDNIYSI
jgi:hypothetical protein